MLVQDQSTSGNGLHIFDGTTRSSFDQRLSRIFNSKQFIEVSGRSPGLGLCQCLSMNNNSWSTGTKREKIKPAGRRTEAASGKKAGCEESTVASTEGGSSL